MKVLYIFDCIDGKLRILRNLPAQVGSSPKSACHLNMIGDAGIFMSTGVSGCTFYPQMAAGQRAEINGQLLTGPVMIEDDKETLLCVGDGLFLAFWSARPEQEVLEMFARYEPNNWYIMDPNKKTWVGPLLLQTFVESDALYQSGAWVMMMGMQQGRTHAYVLREIALKQNIAPPTATQASSPVHEPAVESRESIHTAAPASVALVAQDTAAASQQTSDSWDADQTDEDTGHYTCPVCWLKFNAGDVMSIAAHPDLMGDSVLGRDKMKRFLATRFNARGQALDDTGTPCPDIACPHCRSKLPPHFLESRTHIFSIIGAPSAGKSYYLASLIHEMEITLALDGFSLAWRDSDPGGNSMLNDVSYRLFNAPTPETAYLTKTDLEGALYSEFYRHGRMVKLPKPFVYDIGSLTDPSLNTSLIFYDNAGEHFEPGRSSEDSPGARHVAVADGLFFLFDPVSSPAFRRAIGAHSDPQLAPDAPMRMDQQNIIMAETATRISTILNMSQGQRIDVPLAIMIGKSDLWLDKMGGSLKPIVVDGKLDQSAVDENSALLRNFLIRLHPSLCTTAEMISTCVRYFAVSSLGCSPVKFYDENSGSDKIGPNPVDIAPQRVTEPTLWVLSQIEPAIIPSL